MKCTDETPCDKEKPSGKLLVGAWLSPDDGLTLGAGAMNHRFFSGDHSFRVSATLASRRQELALKYKVPRLLGSGLALETELHDRRVAYESFSRRHTGGSARLTRTLGSGVGMYLGYRIDEASAVLIGRKTEDLRQSGIVASLRAGLTYETLGSGGRHVRSELFVERSSPWLGSEYDFVLAGANANLRQPLIGPLVLDLSGSVQALASEDSFALPLAERLQHEGHADVRGFGIGNVGGPIGGTLKALGRAELQFPLVSSWGLSGALFYDAGLLRDEYRTNLAQSVGGSLIVKTPIGPLRVDLALPLDDAARPQLLLGLGGSF